MEYSRLLTRRTLQVHSSEESVEELLGQMRKDISEGPERHIWFYVTIGQKADL